MKIFDEQNNKMYLQLMDVKYITRKNNIPKSIKKRFLKYDNINNSNKYEFIEINDKDIIEYINNLNYILDYNEYVNSEHKKLRHTTQRINDEINKILDYYTSLPIEERKNHPGLKEDIKDREYMIESVLSFYDVEQHIIVIYKENSKSKQLILN